MSPTCKVTEPPSRTACQSGTQVTFDLPVTLPSRHRKDNRINTAATTVLCHRLSPVTVSIDPTVHTMKQIISVQFAKYRGVQSFTLWLPLFTLHLIGRSSYIAQCLQTHKKKTQDIEQHIYISQYPSKVAQKV